MEKKKIDLYELNYSDTFKKALANNKKFYDFLAESVFYRENEEFEGIIEEFFENEHFESFSVDNKFNGSISVNRNCMGAIFQGFKALDETESWAKSTVKLMGEFGVYDGFSLLDDEYQKITRMELTSKQYKKSLNLFEEILNNMFARMVAYFKYQTTEIELGLLCDIYENTGGEELAEKGIELYLFEGDETHTIYYDVKVSTAF